MYLGSKKFWLGMFLESSFLFLMSACREEVQEPTERIRAIKTITIAEKTSGPKIPFLSGVARCRFFNRQYSIFNRQSKGATT